MRENHVQYCSLFTPNMLLHYTAIFGKFLHLVAECEKLLKWQ
jgi:hypothetical protein